MPIHLPPRRAPEEHVLREDVSWSDHHGSIMERVVRLPGTSAAAGAPWQPALQLYEQRSATADPRRPVLYVHGMSFGAANSILFRFDGTSWADALNHAGFAVWGFDFAGFAGSERYPAMADATPAPDAPLGRAGEAARQIARVVRAIIAQTGVARVSIVAHSWGTIAAGLFATQHPELVDRLVFFGPIVPRRQLAAPSTLGPWRLVTVADQHRRFVEDVPAGHAPVLLEHHFATWAKAYLASDPESGARSPPSVKVPNGPLADVMAAWSGSLAYDPAKIVAPLAIIRGEWDSLCTDADAAGLIAALGSTSAVPDCKIAKGTHLMHLEESRGALHAAAIAFLSSQSAMCFG